MFKAIIRGDTQTLEVLALTFANGHGGRSNASLLRCLDYLSRQKQDVYEMNIEEMNRLLKILRLFGATYRRITRLPQVETENAIQRVFGFHIDESGLEASISPASFLSRVERPPAIMRTNDRNEIVVNARQLGCPTMLLSVTVLNASDTCVQRVWMNASRNANALDSM